MQERLKRNSSECYLSVIGLIDFAENKISRSVKVQEKFDKKTGNEISEDNKLAYAIHFLVSTGFKFDIDINDFLNVPYEEGIILLLVYLRNKKYFQGDVNTEETIDRILDSYGIVNDALKVEIEKTKTREGALDAMERTPQQELVRTTKNIINFLRNFNIGNGILRTSSELPEYLVFLKDNNFLSESQYHVCSIQVGTPITLIADLLIGLLINNTFRYDPEICLEIYGVLEAYYGDRSDLAIDRLDKFIAPYLSYRHYKDPYKITPLPHNSSQS